MDNGLPLLSRWTDTKAPGVGRAQGKNSGLPSSMNPVNLLQIGLTPKSGRLLPTRTVTTAGRLLAESKTKGGSVSNRLSVNKLFKDPVSFG